MSFFKAFGDLLPGIGQVLLGVAAVIAAIKSRKTAKETSDEKQKT